MKKLILVFLCVALLAPGAALAERDAAKDLQQAGEKVGELFAAFGKKMGEVGERIEGFSKQAEDYIANDETLRGLVDKGYQALDDIETYLSGKVNTAKNQSEDANVAEILGPMLGVDMDAYKARAEAAGQSMADYWPNFRASVKPSLEAILASDDSSEEKREELKLYGLLAQPYLAEAALEQGSDRAAAALDVLRQGTEQTAEEIKQQLQNSRQWLDEIKKYVDP